MSRSTLSRQVTVNLVFWDSLESSLIPQQLVVEFNIYSCQTDDQGLDLLQEDFNVTYTKIMTLLDSFMKNSIVVDPQAFVQHRDLFLTLNNNVITLPDACESALVAALFSKLVMLCDQHTLVNYVSITDSDNVTFIHEYNEETLDASSKLENNYLGEFQILDWPWWLRDDTTMSDDAAADAQSQAQIQEQLQQQDFQSKTSWQEVEKTVRSLYKARARSDSTDWGQVVHVNFNKNKPDET